MADHLGDRVLDREEHLNAEAVVVRADEVQDVLTTLRDEVGLDHCSCVTAQEYEDRYETIYHLKSYDDPGGERRRPRPEARPGERERRAGLPAADWHEREAYDLVGIEYEDHPDPRRILLPETWQSHALSLDYDPGSPQVVTLRENANPLQEDRRVDGTDTMLLNIGPHHPATHGVLHLEVTLDGELVADVEPDIGYIHRCEEQMCQQGSYRHQIVPYPDRWDWGGAGLLTSGPTPGPPRRWPTSTCPSTRR